MVRNLKLRNCFAQTVRVHTKHLRRGAVRGVGGRGHQLLRPLHPLHPGPAARTVEPGGGRRARIFRGHKALLQPRARKPAAAGPRRTARRAARPVRGGRNQRAAGQLYAGHRRIEIPLRHGIGRGQHGQPGAEPHHAQPRTSGRRGRRDGRPLARRRDGRLRRRLHGTLRRGDVGAEHLVPGQRQARRRRILRLDLLGRAGPERGDTPTRSPDRSS